MALADERGAQPATHSASMKVLDSSESGEPLLRTPCTDGMRPAISVARLGMQTGVAT
ncbi:MAG TPA: hypothetical protein VK512_19540 [Xanthobacteraceae bacterium]|jgi:hypothetical protein|nr:hypothetical protein [Xanthobacteraceae bacterium]